MKKLFTKANYQLPVGSRWRTMLFWDPLIGCTPCSPGCRICSSARTLGKRKQRTELLRQTNGSYLFNGQVQLNASAFDEVIHFEPNEQIFVCGRSDLFHEEVPSEYTDRIIECANQRPDCTFFAITKRPHRMGTRTFPKNFWISISVENQKLAEKRLPYFSTITGVKVVSAKPLLGPIDFRPFMGLFDMIIVGGEYGRMARPMHPSWPRMIRDQCLKYRKPFSFHNWGLWLPGEGRVCRLVDEQGRVGSGTPIHIHEQGECGTYLDGVIWDQYPCGS